MLVAPALYAATDEQLDLLRDYAAAGGHLVLGIRTGYGDDEARARVEVAPARLAGAAGVHYEEYSNLGTDVGVVVDGGLQEATTDDDGPLAARLWADGLIVDADTAVDAAGAETLARYDHPRFRDFPAVTTKTHGEGRITMVGTVPSPALAAALVRYAVPAPVADALAPGRALPVTVASGRLPDGGRAWFVFNWSWDEQVLDLGRAVRDAVTGEELAAGTTLSLPAWSTRVMHE